MTEVSIYDRSSLAERQQYASAVSKAADLVPIGLHDKVMRQLDTGAWVQDNGRTQPNPGKVLLVMETGAMLGVHPIAALQGVHVIEGKATLSPALMSAVVRQAGHLLRVETSGEWTQGTFKATASLVRRDDPDHPFVVSWDEDRAKRASLLPAKPGSAWSKYPEAMCKARAISEVCREGATDALMGVGYVPEELGVEVNEEGLMTEPAAAAPQNPAPQAAAAPSERREDIIDAEVIDEPAAPSVPAQQPATRTTAAPREQQSKPVETKPAQGGRDWRADADAAPSADHVLGIFNACRDAGELGQLTEFEGEQIQLRVYLRKLGEKLRAIEEQGAPDEGTPAVLDERTGEVSG